jgi:hypothetical protein
MRGENLRSPYEKTEELFFFARMIDKIRLDEGRDPKAPSGPS